MQPTFIANRYELVQKLGAGGMGEVYRAFDYLNDEFVALKRVTVPSQSLMFTSRILLGSSFDYRLALTHEFRALATLRHPNIISVLEYGFDEQHQPYYTMELLENAQNILQAGREKPVDQQIELLVQVVRALEYLHRRGIIHRDLKPDNVLVVDGHVKVVDFGLASTDIVDEKVGDHVVGTLAYMAPEVLQGQSAREPADLYAVGVIAYELFAGKPPYTLTSINDMIQDIVTSSPDMSLIKLEDSLYSILKRLLEKHPEDRYPSARALIHAYAEAVQMPVAQETTMIRESFLQAARFVGRDDEFEQLSSALKQAVGGNGSCWLIGGESGVGKSRLIEEIRTLALVQGALVLKGQSIAEGGAPYFVWRNVLRHLCIQTELSELEASVLKSIIPDIEKLLKRSIGDPVLLDSKAAQQRVFLTIEQVIRRQNQPLVILLEDIHWAGESLSVISHLASIVPELPVFLAATYRDDERPKLPDELPGAQLMLLKRLTSEAISDLSASILGNDVGRQAHVVDLLERETEGNIFFVVEVIRALAEDAGDLEHVGKITLPPRVFADGIKTVIQRRLDRVPYEAMNLLQFAAVAGRQVDPDVLRVLANNEIELNDWLRLCDNAAILDVQDNRWRFAHDKIREALINELSPEISQTFHGEVARAIEQVYPDDPMQYAVLTYHWAHANNPQREAVYAALAGKHALSNSAYYEASSFLERALTVAQDVSSSNYEQGELRFLLGEAYYASGQMNLAREYLEQAIDDLKGKLPSTSGAARETMRQIAHRTGIVGKGRADVIATAPFLLQAYERLAQISYLSSDKLGAVYYVLAGLNLSERLKGEAEVAQVRFYSSICVALGLAPLHWAAEVYRRRADRVSQNIHEYNAIAWLKETTGVYYAGRGRWHDADQRLKDCVEYAEQIGNQRIVDEATENLIALAFYRGDWNRVRQMRTELNDIASKRGDQQLMTWTTLGLAELMLRTGDFNQAISYIHRGEKTAPDETSRTIVHALYCQLYTRTGKLDLAIEYADLVCKHLRSLSPTLYTSWNLYHAICEFYLTQLEQSFTPQHKAVAREALNHTAQYAKVFDIGRPMFNSYTSWFDGINGKQQKAIRLGQRALKAAQHLQMPYEEALAHFQLGRWLPVNHKDRVVHLTTAKQQFEALAARYETNRIDALLS